MLRSTKRTIDSRSMHRPGRRCNSANPWHRAADIALDSVAVYDRHGVGEARAPGSIGFSSVRAGSIVGDHTILFAADEEIIELRHRALDRAVFARGALRAAIRGLPGVRQDVYSMKDVLGL